MFCWMSGTFNRNISVTTTVSKNLKRKTFRKLISTHGNTNLAMQHSTFSFTKEAIMSLLPHPFFSRHVIPLNVLWLSNKLSFSDISKESEQGQQTLSKEPLTSSSLFPLLTEESKILSCYPSSSCHTTLNEWVHIGKLQKGLRKVHQLKISEQLLHQIAKKKKKNPAGPSWAAQRGLQHWGCSCLGASAGDQGVHLGGWASAKEGCD